MVRRNRSCISIINQILDAAANGGSNNYAITKTKIMYKACLGYAQLKEYLQVLTENELLSYNAETQTYKTTEKGLRFLKLYNSIYELFEGVGGEGQQDEEGKEKERELVVAI